MREICLPLLPVCIQSTPNLEFLSLTCFDFIDAKVSIGLSPEFSAKAIGIESSASAKARIAYCSSPGLYLRRRLSVLESTKFSPGAIESSSWEKVVYVDTLSCTYFNGRVLHSQRAGNLSGAPSIDDAIVPYKIPDNAKGVVKRSLWLRQ